MTQHILPPLSAPFAESKWLERGLLVVWTILLFAVCLGLGTRHHRFPYHYHPDEPGKAEQIITGRYNFNHPMLLLATVHLATDLWHTPKEPQAVVEVGRVVSAGFMAGAVVLLSLLAYLWRGWRAAFSSGAALALHHQLYELSHYLKEDSALLFGVAATLLAGMAYAQRATPWRAAILGGACALAISGKYIGVVMLAVALPVLWSGARRAAVRVGRGLDPASTSARVPTARPHWAAFLGALVLVFVAVNFALLFNLVTFGHSFGKEMGLVVHGQGTTTRGVPHMLYWNVFIDNSTPALWLLLIALLTACGQRWRRLTLFQKALVIFPFAFAVMLSFSPKENDRYFLPATAVFTLLAAIGAEAVPLLLSTLSRSMGSRGGGRFLKPGTRNWLSAASVLLLLILQYTGWTSTKPGWSQYDSAFQRDDIADLIAWMNTRLPAQAVVVADGRIGLPSPSRKKNAGRPPVVPQKLIVPKLASDEGTLEQLRAAGVTHVAVSENSYGRFFRRDLHAKDADTRKFQQAQAFYGELLRDGEPQFERDRSTVIYLHPGIRVYQIQPPPAE